MSTPIQFTNHSNVEIDSLKQLTYKKVDRLFRIAPDMTKIHFIFNTDKLMHIAEAELHIPDANICAKAESTDMYKSLDKVISKLKKQLAKHKEIATEHS